MFLQFSPGFSPTLPKSAQIGANSAPKSAGFERGSKTAISE
jgi:hypothetical protein